MKRKTVAFIYFVFAALFVCYTIVLQIMSPASSVFSFCYCWAILGLLFLYRGLILKNKDKNKPFVLFGSIKKPIKIAVISFIGLGVIISCFNLVLILRPVDVLPQDYSPDYVILLGGGITKDKKLSTTAQYRAQKTATFLKTHPTSKVLVTGGQGRFDSCAESEILKQKLIFLGIEKERIIEENLAKDTIQNLSFCAKKIAQDKNISMQQSLEQNVLIITNRFHLQRALTLAKLEGYKNVKGLAAKIPFIIVPNCYAREILAYIKLYLVSLPQNKIKVIY